MLQVLEFGSVEPSLHCDQRQTLGERVVGSEPHGSRDHDGSGDPSYDGFSAGYGVGGPFGASVSTTNTTCLAGCGSSHGDPHYANADGVAIDYQGAGEYLALTSTSHDLDVQVRQQPHAGSLQVAVNTALAANIAGDRVGVYAPDPNLPARPSLFVNGQPNFKTGTISLPHGGRLDVDASTVTITWPDGTSLVVHKVPVINVEYSIASSRKGAIAIFADGAGVIRS